MKIIWYIYLSSYLYTLNEVFQIATRTQLETQLIEIYNLLFTVLIVLLFQI